MNFNFSVSKPVAEYVAKTARNLKRSEDSIVKEALEDWLLKNYSCVWPDSYFENIANDVE